LPFPLIQQQYITGRSLPPATEVPVWVQDWEMTGTWPYGSWPLVRAPIPIVTICEPETASVRRGRYRYGDRIGS